MTKTELNHLRGRLRGQVSIAAATREHFATDGSIFTQVPQAVVYPRDAADVQALLGYLWEKAEAGKPVPGGVTARGGGSDQTGAAVGEGMVLALTAHLNRLVRLDKATVVVEPGLPYRALQEALKTHGRFLPPFPSSIDFATIGGSIANNAGGEKSVKYGSTRTFVRSLKLVLADGTLVTTRRLSGRELSQKKGQTDLEGEIYRRIDGLILDHEKLLKQAQPKTTKNVAGYDLWDVRRPDGTFDLTPLLVGSQGTLGVITQATLATRPACASPTLVVAYCDDFDKAGQAVVKLRALGASAIEMIDRYVLETLREDHPKVVEGLIPETLPRVVLMVEFDDQSALQQTLKSRRAAKLLDRAANQVKIISAAEKQQELWDLRHSAAVVMTHSRGKKQALPFIEDAAVPPAKLPQLLERTYALLRQHDLEAAVWGHAGDANLHLQPLIDLSRPKEVEKLYAVMRGFADIVTGLDGTLSGEHGDGQLRGPFLERQFGPEVCGLFQAVKDAFDPHGLLNPGKKVGVTEAAAREHLRRSYDLTNIGLHWPTL